MCRWAAYIGEPIFLEDIVSAPGRSLTVQALAEVAGFTEPLTQVDGKATAYVCMGFSCGAPTNDPEELEKTLERFEKTGETP